ncbi:hypothetical protein NADE_001032 [Nannochloris sp. 'desiccata']|nr:hypothetical protein NADE_001032 [Chlorella desiccata (nom. nud.)]
MLRQTKKIISLLQLCDKHHEAFSISLRTAEALRLDLQSPAAIATGQSLFSTQAAGSNFNLAATPQSLAYPRLPMPVSTGKEKPSLVQSVMLRLGGYYSKESRLMRAAGGLYDSVTEIAINPRFFKLFEIPAGDFQHQHAALCLHMWLLLTRLRPEGTEGKELAQLFYDNFQDDLEMRVRSAGVKVKVRGQLAELEKQFYGSCMAYDKALKKEGTETLDMALLRNVYQGADGKEAVASKLERSSKSALTAPAEGNTSTPVLIALAAGLAGFFLVEMA